MKELDDVFDDDVMLDEVIENELNVDSPSQTGDIFDELTTSANGENKSLLEQLLQTKGFKDNKVVILGEDNNQEEVDFFSLSTMEQLQLLNDEAPAQTSEISNSEKLFLENLKASNLTIESFLEDYKNKIISENTTQTPSYEIDSYDDQELFLLDLKSKYDLTDDELSRELEKELKDPDLFTKKTTKLREEYKQLEDNYKKEQDAQLEQGRVEQYNKFVDLMVDTAIKTPELYNIELEDSEKNEVLAFILDLDENGTSDFYKSLNDPSKLYKAAWFLKYGEEAFDAIRNTYEQEMSKTKQDRSQVVIKSKDKKELNIHDLF
jgi:hypothetical protein